MLSILDSTELELRWALGLRGPDQPVVGPLRALFCGAGLKIDERLTMIVLATMTDAQLKCMHASASGMFQLDTRILISSECLAQMTSMSTRCIDSFQGVTCSIGAFNSSEVHAFFEEDWRYAKNFTMTTARAGFLVYSEIFRISGGAWSTEANSLHNDGAVVEVGVWKGGSSMLMALAHKRALPRARADYHSARQFYLFDTFDGLPAPGEPVLGARSNLPLPSTAFHRLPSPSLR